MYIFVSCLLTLSTPHPSQVAQVGAEGGKAPRVGVWFPLTIHPFRGMLQQRKGPKNPKHIPPNVPYENCSHFCEHFRFFGGRTFSILGVEKYL